MSGDTSTKKHGFEWDVDHRRGKGLLRWPDDWTMTTLRNARLHLAGLGWHIAGPSNWVIGTTTYSDLELLDDTTGTA